MASERRRLAGRTALLTGATSGIGAPTARLLDAEGARVALLGRRLETLEALAAELHDPLIVTADLADPAAVVAAAEQTLEHFGGLDILVNNAGHSSARSLADLTEDEWNRALAVDLTAPFLLAKTCAESLRAGTGSVIVNISSAMSTIGMRNYVHYTSAKAGLDGLTRALAAELAPQVRVVGICPGPVDTKMTRDEMPPGDPDAVLAEIAKQIPLGYLAGPEEIARAILFVVAEATYMTASSILIDGGIDTVIGG